LGVATALALDDGRSAGATGHHLILGGSARRGPGGDRLGHARKQLVDDLVARDVDLGREAADRGLQLGGGHLDAVLDAWLGPEACRLDAGLTPLLGAPGGLPDGRGNPLAQLICDRSRGLRKCRRAVLKLLFLALGVEHEALQW